MTSEACAQGGLTIDAGCPSQHHVVHFFQPVLPRRDLRFGARVANFRRRWHAPGDGGLRIPSPSAFRRWRRVGVFLSPCPALFSVPYTSDAMSWRGGFRDGSHAIVAGLRGSPCRRGRVTPGPSEAISRRRRYRGPCSAASWGSAWAKLPIRDLLGNRPRKVANPWVGRSGRASRRARGAWERGASASLPLWWPKARGKKWMLGFIVTASWPPFAAHPRGAPSRGRIWRRMSSMTQPGLRPSRGPGRTWRKWPRQTATRRG